MNDDSAGGAHDRRILLATLGVFPQIVTETLYALATEPTPFLVNEIHVVTTVRGAARVREQLLGPGSRILTLSRELGLPDLVDAFSEERLHVIRSGAGKPLDDIDSEADNAACADMVVELMRTLTADPASALHVSIAGGRKTMGFLMGYALSLFARPQDELSHILVDEPYQSHPDFHYPTREEHLLTLRDGSSVDARHANLSLARIPVVRLRHGIPASLLTGAESYSRTVEEAQALLDPRELVVDFEDGALYCQGRRVPLSPSMLAFAAMLARRATLMTPLEAAVHYTTMRADEYNEEYERARLARDELATPHALLSEPVTKEWFEVKLSQLRREMRGALGPLAERYEPQPLSGRPVTRTGFDLPAEAIAFR